MADVPTDADSLRHSGAGTCQDYEVPPGIGHSIRPDAPCPEIVLVAVMSDGSYLLVGYPQGEPAAFVVSENTNLLRRGLDDAFGNSTDEAAGRNGNSNETIVPYNRALRIEKAQR